MKKKSSAKIDSQEPTTSIPATSQPLKTLIDDTSVFIDDLVKLIPARFFLPIPDADERPWFQGLSKAAKASLKKQSRENLKKVRRDRFNPENPSSTLDLLQKSIKPDEDNPGDDEIPNRNPKPEEKSVTYEELRQRLHRRIEELRSGRNTRPKNDLMKNDQRKRKRENEEKSLEETKGKGKDENVAADITFGKVKIGDEDGSRRKKKKMSKAQELEKARKLEELKKDPEKGAIVAKKHSWKAAESRAMGVKVHDDPKLLKESIKKEKKRQKKHAEKWKERVESRESVRNEKQKTRTGNIKERAHQKKMRKIEKREKKLMRPGFEGRKEGYVN
ncbi:uncharacterized protein A4U43_C04F16320 [Asparagus officinalis]|uniref:Ribosomal RNA-processing protein 14/surfeit locus protein 6 C-terminal domain-containing protein n=1 Tax=Asparagus officinalis TaxID=4686 RepID=A0A5P1F654_ASPOF|nr:surfeit locus protein 6-like [Asparagus officinalis]ONK72151.1 uncharacterized protein A4U43_C04F16320 [Asparagus officinalis]